MKRLFLYALEVQLIFAGCSSPVHSSLRAVHIEGSIPVPGSDTSMSNGYDIFYFEGLVMYKFEYGYDSFVNEDLVKHEKRPSYFVFAQDSSFGYAYYPCNDSKQVEGRMCTDTMFQRNAFTPFHFESLISGGPDSAYINEQNDRVEIYHTQSSLTYPGEEKYYLYYSEKFAGLRESFFSKSMKDKSGRKLFKIRIVDGRDFPGDKKTLPQKESLYEMSERPVQDPAVVMQYFFRYKRDVLKL